jgi:hypothetical protein
MICGKLTSIVFEATTVQIIVIAYIRRVCGDKVDQIECRNNPKSFSALKVSIEDLSAIGRKSPHNISIHPLCSMTGRAIS